MSNEEIAPKAPVGQASSPSCNGARKLNGEGKAAGVITDYIAVARGSDLVVVRVVGQGTMLTAPALAEFAEQQLAAGFRRFVFDLERCLGLDSTFLGTMVGLQMSLNAEAGDSAPSASGAQGPGGLVCAVNVPQELANLMAMLGVDKFLRIRGAYDLGQLETAILAEKDLSPDEQRRLILKAHDSLIQTDRRNEARFGPFLKSLSQALASGQ